MWYETVIKLLLAAALSGIIGFERENLNRPAGLRTHVLVCVGAAVVQITSQEYYSQFIGGYSPDAFRLGAQVISGIGFLGAGTIIKEGNSIKGLTTAAGLWTVACIGLTVGTGLYKEAVFAALTVLCVLKGLRLLERMLLRSKKSVMISLEVYNSSDKIIELLGVLDKYELNIQALQVRNMRDSIAEVEMAVTYEKKIPFSKIMREISVLTGIRNIEFMS